MHIQYQLIHCTFMSSLASLFTGSVWRASFYRRMGHQTHLRPQWLSLQTVLVEVLIPAGWETLRTVLTELQKHCTEGDVPHHGSDKILSRSRGTVVSQVWYIYLGFDFTSPLLKCSLTFIQKMVITGPLPNEHWLVLSNTISRIY